MFAIRDRDASAEALVQRVEANFTVGLPAPFDGADPPFLNPDLLLDLTRPLGGYDDRLVLGCLAVRDPSATMAIAAFARLGRGLFGTPIAERAFSFIEEGGRHIAVRALAAAAARPVASITDLPSHMDGLIRRALEIATRDARRDLSAYLRDLFAGAALSSAPMHDLLRLTIAARLDEAMRQRVVHQALTSPGVAPSVHRALSAASDLIPGVEVDVEPDIDPAPAVSQPYIPPAEDLDSDQGWTRRWAFVPPPPDPVRTIDGLLGEARHRFRWPEEENYPGRADADDG